MVALNEGSKTRVSEPQFLTNVWVVIIQKSYLSILHQ